MLQMLFRVCVEQKVITERKYASFDLSRSTPMDAMNFINLLQMLRILLKTQ